MDWGFLSFLASPWFIVPWYAVGLAGAAWVAYETRRRAQTLWPLVPTTRTAWPVVVLFLSVIGIALYFFASRSRRPARAADSGKRSGRAPSALQRVTSADLRTTGAGAVGIAIAMVIARSIGVSFWQEFWLEFFFGLFVGWVFFEYAAMKAISPARWSAFGKGLRAEFFSMLPRMAGVGFVVGYVTPLVVGRQPPPQTFAFWGFLALGLFIGFVLSWPMNWMLELAGWNRGFAPLAAGEA